MASLLLLFCSVMSSPERKISAVFAVEGSRPIGLLHMLDLVRSGVV